MPATIEEKTQPPQNVSRARAIFSAAEEAKPFDPADFDFAMAEEEAAQEVISPSLQESNPAMPLTSRPVPQAKRVLGMTRPQLLIIATMAIALLCILAIFAYVFFSPNPILP
jgi:hypothetical protein